jgi:capsular exopolysaccharide synthesis family protein
MTAEQIPAILWRRRVTFAVTFVLILAAAAVVIATLPKVYETRAYLYISSGNASGGDFAQVQTNQVITKTFAELLLTRNVANDVAARLPFDQAPTALQGAVSVAAVPESQLITITASGSTPRRAQAIANTYASVFIQHASSLTRGDSTVRLAESAPIISNQSSPRPKLYLLVAAFLAAFVAAAVAILRHRTDQRLELSDSDTELGGIAVIGRIPRVRPSAMTALWRGDDLQGRADLDEPFRLVMANLAFAHGGQRPGSIAILSASQGEGKSSASLALARAGVEFGAKTLLVDADLRRPRLSHELLGGAIPRAGGGLSTVLRNHAASALTDAVMNGDDESFDFLPAGPRPVNPSALLGSEDMVAFVARAHEIYDLVIFDTPPISAGADASLIAAAAEGVVLVVDTRSTRRAALSRALDQLRRAGATVLGIVANRATDELATPYYGEPAGRGGRLERDLEPTER